MLQINSILAAGGGLTKSGFLEHDTIKTIAAVLFGCAVTHTFLVKFFEKMAHKYRKGSIRENLFHFLAEVEAVFGIWALFLIVAMCCFPSATHSGWSRMVAYLSHEVNFTEPMFVFVIMAMAATAPVIYFADKLIAIMANLMPMKKRKSFYCSALIVGPLLGSFITEPAAMTVTALILKRAFFDHHMTTKFKYVTIGVLFVNVSIGGTLTHFAAPPVLMVAGSWGWGMSYMIGAFGWKSAVAVVINTLLVATIFSKELKDIQESPALSEAEQGVLKPTWWVIAIHLFFLAAVVVAAHDIPVFMGLFLFFLGWCKCSNEYQEELKLTEALLVGFFLAGLVTLGKLQGWWLQPIISKLGELPLFVGATGLTAITDNAALTYLGTQIQGMSDAMKYALVAGAVAGGGLTVIANAPNPAGFGILKSSFGRDGISPKNLLLGALVPTFIAMLCLWFLPDIKIGGDKTKVEEKVKAYYVIHVDSSGKLKDDKGKELDLAKVIKEHKKFAVSLPSEMNEAVLKALKTLEEAGVKEYTIKKAAEKKSGGH